LKEARRRTTTMGGKETSKQMIMLRDIPLISSTTHPFQPHQPHQPHHHHDLHTMSLPSISSIQPLSNHPRNPTDLEFQVWLQDVTVQYAPLLDGRQFKDDWREIATQTVLSGTKEDRKCLAALEVLFAVANKEFRWCPETTVPHASPNACPDCCRLIKSMSHCCKVIGRLEETSAKLWYSAEAKQHE
jgi:hypothetical protein